MNAGMGERVAALLVEKPVRRLSTREIKDRQKQAERMVLSQPLAKGVARLPLPEIVIEQDRHRLFQARQPPPGFLGTLESQTRVVFGAQQLGEVARELRVVVNNNHLHQDPPF